jgi:hypothetical protein
LADAGWGDNMAATVDYADACALIKKTLGTQNLQTRRSRGRTGGGPPFGKVQTHLRSPFSSKNGPSPALPTPPSKSIGRNARQTAKIPVVLDPDHHFHTFMDLLEMEREAEKEENKRKLDRWPVEMREQLGKTVARLSIEHRDVGVGGLPLLILSRQGPGRSVCRPFTPWIRATWSASLF